MPAPTRPRAADALLVALATLLVAGLALAQRGPRGPGAGARTDAGASSDAAALVAADGGTAGDADPTELLAGDDAGGALADAESPEARRLRASTAFARGMAAYRRGDYETAARDFGEAYDALPDPAPLFNMARSFEGAGDTPRAIETYQRYITEAPRAPDRAQVLERIAMLRTRRARVLISSEPSNAFVSIDGREVPHPLPTPTEIELPPGLHFLALDHEGYGRAIRQVDLGPGQTLSVFVRLQRDAGSTGTTRSRVDRRILNRRSISLFTPRFTFMGGLGRPWNDQPFNLSLAGEVTLFLGRSLAFKLRYERIEPADAWNIFTADFGYVFVLEDIDIGLYAVAGSAIGWLDSASYMNRATVPSRVVLIAGGELRVDWVFHPHLSTGVYFRGLFRNFFITDIETLFSFGLSISLFL